MMKSEMIRMAQVAVIESERLEPDVKAEIVVLLEEKRTTEIYWEFKEQEAAEKAAEVEADE